MVRVSGPVADAKVSKIVTNVEQLLIRIHGVLGKVGITPASFTMSLWSYTVQGGLIDETWGCDKDHNDNDLW